jgi:acyl carrier protein
MVKDGNGSRSVGCPVRYPAYNAGPGDSVRRFGFKFFRLSRIRSMPDVAGVREILRHTLNLAQRADMLEAATPLLGSIPELDSMAVVAVLTAIEEQYGVVIDDGEISAQVFETVGSLAEFVDAKVRG